MKHLMAIQQELKVQKKQYNDFGGYYYRSAEDILEAAKPICASHGCLLTLTDDVVTRGEGANIRFYIKSTAKLQTPDTLFEIDGFAREEEKKKGMDAAQVTGATSSYARKYALGGLFDLDDGKDYDTYELKRQQNNAIQAEKAQQAAAASQASTNLSKEQLIEKVVMLADTKRMRVSDLCAMAKPPVVELAEMDETRLAALIDWMMQQQ